MCTKIAIYDFQVKFLISLFNSLTPISLQRMIFQQFRTFSVDFLFDKLKVRHNSTSSLCNLLTYKVCYGDNVEQVLSYCSLDGTFFSS